MKRQNFPRRREKRASEAAERLKTYKPNPERYGLRRQVKEGLITPNQAYFQVGHENISPTFDRWLQRRRGE